MGEIVREDYLEQMEKMFPNGYLILYTNPNDTLRIGLFNPEELDEIHEAHQHMLGWGKWKYGGKIG